VFVTIYDIAEKADVSIATVSRAFNNHPRVSEKTRKRIFEIAELHHYQPNISARNLARQSSFVVSAVIPMVTNYFFMEVLRGLQDKLAESDFDLMVYSILTPEQADEQLSRALQKGRSEGVLLFSTWITDEQAQWLNKAHTPLILVDSYHAAFDSMTVDNEHGGYLATKHLIDLGHKRIGLVAGNSVSTPARERHKGYKRAIEEAGFEVDANLVSESGDERFHGFSEEEGYKSMMALLEQNQGSLDAVFFTSDVQALGGLRALKDSGLRVPEDVALIGYDDVKLASYAGLSTMRQPMYEMGCTAVDMLFKRMKNPEKAAEHHTFSAELMVRESSKNSKI
jgi:LacI family transcriptional regulator